MRDLTEDEAAVVDEIEKEIGACNAMIANINAGRPAKALAKKKPKPMAPVPTTPTFPQAA